MDAYQVFNDDNLLILAALIVLGIGIIVGAAFGAVRVHLPLINYFRDYHRRRADERIAAHTLYLKNLMDSIGTTRVARTQPRTVAVTEKVMLRKALPINFSVRVVRTRNALPFQKRRNRL